MYIDNVIIKHNPDMNGGTKREQKENYRTVNLEINLYMKLAEIAKNKNTNLRKYVNDIVSYMVEREEMLLRMEPFLHIISAQDNSLFIKDSKIDKVAEVVLSVDQETGKYSLHCRLDDNSTDCVHVAFARASNELGQLHK